MPNREIVSLKLQLAAELAPAQWARPLTRFSNQLNEGKLWPDAVALAKAPRALKHLLLAVSYCPDPLETLCQWLRLNRNNKTLLQALRPLLYPCLLLLGTFLVTSAMAWVGAVLTAGSEWIDWSTGRTDNLFARLFSSHWTRSLGAMSLMGWLILVGLIVYFLGSPLTRLSVAIDLPAFGKLIRWQLFRDLHQSLSLFLSSGISAEKAGQAVVECYRGSLLAIPAAGIAKRIHDGQSMDRVICNSTLCDEFLGPAAQSLVRSQEQTSQGIQGLANLANQLFEQRGAALSQIANRIGLLLVLCMYAKFGADVAMATKGMFGSIRELEFVGTSENWFVFLPLAIVNFIFLNSMFSPKRSGSQSGIASTIRLFEGVCLAMALIGLTLRMTSADLIYLFPVALAVLALRANNRAMNRFAAASSLMLGAKTPGMSEWIATHLIDNCRGQLRRRVKRFSRLIENGTSFGIAIARSKLVTDHHESWVVALLSRFGNLPESHKILLTSSPWSQSSTQLVQRINLLKWMVLVFSFSTFFVVVFQLGAVWPTYKVFLQDAGISRVESMERLHAYSDSAFEWFMAIEDIFYMSAYNQALLLSTAVGPALLTFLICMLPFVRRWFLDLFLSPLYRAWTLRGISEVLLSEPQLVHVLNESSRMHPLAMHRYRLSKLSRDIQVGVSVPNAFARSKMIGRSQRGLLELANQPSQLAWALHQIADRNFFRWIERYSMCLDILMLLIVIATALVIGYFGYVQFQVLSSIIVASVNR